MQLPGEGVLVCVCVGVGVQSVWRQALCGPPCDRTNVYADGALQAPALPQPPPLPLTPAPHWPHFISSHGVLDLSSPFSAFLPSFTCHTSPFSVFVLVLLLPPASSVCIPSAFNQNLTSTTAIVLVPSPSLFYYLLSFGHWFCIISLISSPAVFLISLISALRLPLCP